MISPLRSIDPILTSEAKCFVMALLYLSQPLPVAELEAWVRSDSRPYVSNAATRFHRVKYEQKTDLILPK